MTRIGAAAALLLALFSAACGGGGGGDSAPVGGTVCDDNATIALGEYTVVDNVYAGTGVTHTVCAKIAPGTASSVNASWNWSWPTTGAPASFPEVVYGQKPWDAKSTTTRLPKKLSQLQSVIAHVDWTNLNVDASTWGYLNFDVWLVSSLTPDTGSDHMPVAALVSVMLETYQGATWAHKQRSVHLDFVPPPGTTPADCNWDVYYELDHPSAAYFPTSGCGAVLSAGTPVDFDIVPFLEDYAANEGSTPVPGKPVGFGQVSGDTYMAALELGTHVGSGSGETSVDGYKATVTLAP